MSKSSRPATNIPVAEGSVKSPVLAFQGNEFHLIANAGATLWQYCLDTQKTPEDFAIGIKGLSKEIDSIEKSEVICADKVLLIGVFEEILKLDK